MNDPVTTMSSAGIVAGIVLDTTFKVCQTTGIRLLTHTRLHINLFYNGIEGMFNRSLLILVK